MIKIMKSYLMLIGYQGDENFMLYIFISTAKMNK